MIDQTARAVASKALIQSGGGTGGVVSQLNNKIKTSVFTATVTNTTNIVHNLLNYDKLHDELQVTYNGILLELTDNYTENVNLISVDLVSWSIGISERIRFKMYKGIK